MSANTKEQGVTQSNAKTRPRRTPLHNRDILTVRNKNPNKEYRWVSNSTSDRLYRFTEAGWEFVTDKGLVVGEPTVNADKELGSVIVKQTGAFKLYLMCIDKEFYDEDQAAKARDVDDAERAMYEQLNSTSDGQYGGVSIKRD